MGFFVVHKDSEILIYKSWHKYCNHWSLQTSETNALYSASKEDMDNVNCFLDLHEIKEFPINTQ